MNDVTAEDSPDNVQVFEVMPTEEQERLDSWMVSRFPGFSRVKLQRAIARGEVLVDGEIAKSSTRLKVAQRVEVKLLKPESEAPIPEPIPLEILFEDIGVIAVNKPSAMVVHPAKGHWQGTLTAALAHHCQSLSSVGGPARPGIVHRLDRDTSGVILVAKNDEAHFALAAQFEARSVNKEYLAIVSPPPNRDRDMIEKPIGDHPYQREKKAIREDHPSSREASTFYEVIERFQGFALIRVKPKTGRTHQIRVHMTSIGSPVLCDALYSGRSKLSEAELSRQGSPGTILHRQALHAHSIEFTNPTTGNPMSITAPLAADIELTLERLRQYRRL